MDFTETQQEILYRAWLLARDGNGQVVDRRGDPGRARARRAGLARAPLGRNGDLSWWWTPAAEAALDVSALLTRRRPR